MTRIDGADDDVARGDRLCLRRWDFRMDRTRSSHCCLPPGCANSAAKSCSSRLGDAATDYWDLKPQVMEAVLTEHPGLVRRPKAARARGLRGAACRCSWRSARAAAPSLRGRYDAMAMGAGPYRNVREPGLQPDPDAARLARHQQSRPRAGTTRSIAGRARSVTMLSLSRNASAPGCGSSPISRRRTIAMMIVDARPIRQTRCPAFCRSAAALARFRLACARPIRRSRNS